MNSNRRRGREGTTPRKKWQRASSYGQLQAISARKEQFQLEEQQSKTFTEQVLSEDLEENPLDI